jgi:hypothetical protein
VEPELGRDATVAVVLVAAIVALVTGSIGFGAVILVGAALLVGAAVLIRSRHGAPRHSRTTDPRH